MLQNQAPLLDGLVRIYAVANTAAEGNAPVEALTLKACMRYAERTVGIARYYSAMQNNVKIDYVLRCHRLRDVSTQDVAVPTADGQQYRIVQVQYPEGSEPPMMDLSLERLEADYEFSK